jgi:hypothetical protein
MKKREAVVAFMAQAARRLTNRVNRFLGGHHAVSTATAKRTILNTASAAILCAVAFLLSAGHGNTADRTASPDVEIDAKAFRCITKMTPVRHFYADNLRGDLDATLAAANSPTGAVYPPGSVIQLVPSEAMVKRSQGFNTATHDWEFFELDVSKDGTQIRKRGFTDVVNRFGGNCFGCHIAARPEWDLVCEADHGCAPIPLTREMSGALQRTDPRCDNRPVSAQDAEALRQLNELVKPR